MHKQIRGLLCLHGYVHVSVCMYIQVCIYTSISMFIFVYVCMWVYTNVYACTLWSAYVYEGMFV